MSRIFSLAVALSLTATAALAQTAPEPAKAVDAARFYQGRWHEIGRRPMFITRNCVAGTTDYAMVADGSVTVVDGCRQDTPQGREKTIKGHGRILDPGANAKLRVRYNFLITWDYWVLDHASDYSWFISSDPKFKNLFIFTREIPTPAQRAVLVERAAKLGYDTSKLEFPAQP